jgi:hypothetical protein
MTPDKNKPKLARDVRSTLSRVRWRIRSYVWLEGIALAILWLGITFWAGLALDYLPVMVGASEMPREARIVLLAVIAAILAYVLYRWILKRTFVRLPDHSMALLLERRFDRFHDGLVTSVELAENPEHASQFNPEMLEFTSNEARSHTRGVRVGEVFRLRPLLTKGILAFVAIGSIGLLYAVNAHAVEIWTKRLYLLTDDTWPRKTRIEILGVQIQRQSSLDGTPILSDLIPFDAQREIKVAKGTSVVLKVAADATKSIPEYCSVYYRTTEDENGRVTMQKLGRIRDDLQTFVFDGKPFRGILASTTFDVRGNDHRVRDFHLTVVPSPAIVETKLACEFPDYMVNEELSTWLPRTIDLASGTQLPMGTRINIRAKANKDLVKVDIHNPDIGETTTLEIPESEGESRQIEFLIPKLEANLALEITLHDVDGVVSDPPERIYVGCTEDQPPNVDVALKGIGTAVTPNVVLPAQGTISDDYDVNQGWYEVLQNDGEIRKLPFALGEGGDVDARLDFRALRGEEGGIDLKPKDKIAVTISADDRCDLFDSPNVGTGDRYQLEVVTSDELLAMLERRELGLRRRFEQIIDELGEMRDSLSRVRRDADTERGAAPEDSTEDGSATAISAQTPPTGADQAATDDDAEQRDREQALRLLRTQRAQIQSQKSKQEIIGVAASFDDIREELINNRVDSEDRKSRLKEQISDPLKLVADTLFDELVSQLETLEQKLDDPAASDETVDIALQQTDDILLELDKILQKMLELETFNELIGIVRSLLDDQKELAERTKKERANQARDLLK